MLAGLLALATAVPAFAAGHVGSGSAGCAGNGFSGNVVDGAGGNVAIDCTP